MRKTIILAAAMALLAGCGVTVVRKVRSPQPLNGEKLPIIYLPEVEDRSGTHRVGIVTNTESAGPVLRRALVSELERLGLAVADNKEDADAVLSAVVIENSLETFPRPVPSMRARITCRLTLLSRSGKRLWASDLIGLAEAHGMGRPNIKLLKEIVEEAAADAANKIGPKFDTEDLVAKVFRADPAAGAEPTAAAAPPKAPAPRTVRSDVDELPAAPAAGRRSAHAIVVGIRTYRAGLPEADFADSDARLVSRYLTKVLGYPEANVATLVNEGAAQSDFTKYFERWLPNRVRQGDEVFVYYSGHGAPNPATGDAYLVPYDGDPTYLDQTAFPLKRMYELLAKLPASKMTVVMDSCFSGAGGRSVLAKGAKPLVTVRLGAGIPAHVSVLSASSAEQISHAYQEKGHGLFTYFLLREIKAGVGRGELDIKAAFEAAAPQVSDVARRDYNADQVPQWGDGQ